MTQFERKSRLLRRYRHYFYSIANPNCPSRRRDLFSAACRVLLRRARLCCFITSFFWRRRPPENEKKAILCENVKLADTFENPLPATAPVRARTVRAERTSTSGCARTAIYNVVRTKFKLHKMTFSFFQAPYKQIFT